MQGTDINTNGIVFSYNYFSHQTKREIESEHISYLKHNTGLIKRFEAVFN